MLEYPEDETGYRIEDQFYIGSSGLLVKPVTAADVHKTTLYLSDAQVSLPVYFLCSDSLMSYSLTTIGLIIV